MVHVEVGMLGFKNNQPTARFAMDMLHWYACAYLFEPPCLQAFNSVLYSTRYIHANTRSPETSEPQLLVPIFATRGPWDTLLCKESETCSRDGTAVAYPGQVYSRNRRHA